MGITKSLLISLLPRTSMAVVLATKWIFFVSVKLWSYTFISDLALNTLIVGKTFIAVFCLAERELLMKQKVYTSILILTRYKEKTNNFFLVKLYSVWYFLFFFFSERNLHHFVQRFRNNFVHEIPVW